MSPDARLDPALAAYLADLVERRVPKVWEVTPAQARQGFRARTAMIARHGSPPDVGSTEDRAIPGPPGAPDLPVRTYRPAHEGPHPTVLFVHGGGWVLCDLDTHDGICRSLTVDARAVVVSLDYRLAPEHPFPAAVEDSLAAARWVRDHLRGLGGSAVWGMAGDSAGGNLTAVVTHLLRDEADGPGGPIASPPMAAQLLIYPGTDVTGDFPSRTRLGRGYGLEEDSIAWFGRHYAAGAELTDPLLSPLRFPSHGGLPPAVVVTAGFDPLRDEGIAYAAALASAGVPVVRQDAPTMFHGFADFGPMVPAAAEALRAMGIRFGDLLREAGVSAGGAPSSSSR